MSKINKIKLSGTTYDVEDANASKAVELTQAEYDALVQAGTVDPNTFYIITDAQAVDISEYWTSGQTQSAIDSAVSGKQDTLSAGTGIDITNNVISATGGGGGKAVSGGTNISITTGETADTINCTLPITVQTQSQDYNNLVLFNQSNNVFSHNKTSRNIIFGSNNQIGNPFDSSSNNIIIGHYNTMNQGFGGTNPSFNFFVGDYNNIGKNYSENASHTAVFGTYLTPKNSYEYAFGKYNNSVTGSATWGDSGNTLFSVGNGTSNNARHNAFEIRQNGDIYITLDGQDVKLQDQLGGGGSTYSAGTGIDITNDVISVTGMVATSAITTSITSSSTDAQVPSAKAVYDAIPTTTSAVTSGSTAVVESGAVYSQLGGLKLVKLTQTEYDNLGTKDSNTLYVITTS